MYKLKEEYKGVTISKTGRNIILDNVKSNEVELMGLQSFFTKKSLKTSKKKK